MLRVVFIAFSLCPLHGGKQDAYRGWKHPNPERMTVAEFAASDQSAEWVVLTDAKLNLLKAAVLKKGKDKVIKKLYVPIESEEIFQKEKVSLLLDTNDKELLQIAAELYEMSEGEQLKYIVKNRDKLLRESELSGTMSGKGTMSADRVEEMRSIVKNLGDDFHIMKHNATVNLTRGLIISVVALFFLILALRRRKKSAVPSGPETSVVA